MNEYIFHAYYFNGDTRLIKVTARNRADAYERATARAIKIKNDLFFVELN
jgi:hypothetical protein